ncbi:MAG: MFS transporter, partial [Candidatus Heimdallarchaeota archaeon]
MENSNKIDEQLILEDVLVTEKKTFKQYLFLFSGQQISMLGSSIVSFAIIWWLTITTQSEMMLGIASLVSLGPYVLVAPFSGMLADKFNRKTILIIVDAFQAVVTVTLSILFLTNHVSTAIIFVILGLRGTAQAFQAPVSMSIAPTMVPKKQLSRMNGLSYLFSGLINIVGPAIGAALFVIPGINLGMVLWVDLITFVIAIIPLIIVKIPSVVKPEEEEGQVKESFIMQMTEGFTALKNIKGMLALLFGAMTVNFFMSPLMALLPLFVNKVHGGTEVNYALVIGMLQAALVVGGLFMSLFKGFKKPVLIFLFSLIVQACCQIALTFVPTDIAGRFWIIGAILFVLAIPFSILDVSFITSIQVLVPKEKLGRVIATIMAISPAIRPLGQFLSGVIAEYTGMNIILIVSAVLAVVSLLAIYLFTPLRRLDSVIQNALAESERKETPTEENAIDAIHFDEESSVLKT